MATQVTLEGSVLLPDGNGPAGGSITYKLSGNAKDSSGNKIVGRGIIAVPDGGLLTGAGHAIVATTDLTPSTVFYTARYDLIDAHGNIHSFEETWSDVDHTDTTQNIGDLAG